MPKRYIVSGLTSIHIPIIQHLKINARLIEPLD